VSRIAAALGYGDTTAFARAFKGWSGAAPATWRREHEQAE
jgi:AraC-like DNA-binding protein